MNLDIQPNSHITAIVTKQRNAPTAVSALNLCLEEKGLWRNAPGTKSNIIISTKSGRAGLKSAFNSKSSKKLK